MKFKNYDKVSQTCRSFFADEEYLPEACRLYTAAMMDLTPTSQDNPFFTTKEQKYFKRAIQKAEENFTDKEPLIHLYALFGHLFLCSKGYSLAVKFYLKALKLRPNDRILNLCVGIAFIHRSQQKNDLRSENITRGLAFLRKHTEILGECPESWYNLARAYQHFGLPHLAIPYYEKVLDQPPNELTFPAGRNLAMLYVNSGSLNLAHEILKKHCTI